MTQPLVDSVTAAKLEQYLNQSRAGFKVFYGPLYSANDLAGIARTNNAGTHQIDAQTISFFQVSIGQIGQGFARPMRLVETNLDGSPGSLPGGYSFVGHTLGVYFPPTMPIPVKDWLTRHASLVHVRHSNQWPAGAVQFWPEASFGHQSASVTTTIANSLIQYGVNGAAASRAFPDGGELYYPAKEVIRFDVILHEPTFVTVDGLTASGADFPAGNQIPAINGALLYVLMEGYRFEKLSA